jgi:hypothetical protein
MYRTQVIVSQGLSAIGRQQRRARGSNPLTRWIADASAIDQNGSRMQTLLKFFMHGRLTSRPTTKVGWLGRTDELMSRSKFDNSMPIETEKAMKFRETLCLC